MKPDQMHIKLPYTERDWVEVLNRATAERSPLLLDLAAEAVRDQPRNHQILYLAALAALVAERPEACLRYLHRMEKNYYTDGRHALLRAVAQAQQGLLEVAQDTLKEARIATPQRAIYWFLGDESLDPWLTGWVKQILSYTPPPSAKSRARKSASPAHTDSRTGRDLKSRPIKGESRPIKGESQPIREKSGPELGADIVLPELPQYQPEIPLRFELTNADAIRWDSKDQPEEDFDWFRIREEFAHLDLLQGFDELLCLPQLHQVDTYWYQVETVRKVLKSFRGRVLLADEVGLGKTIEAGMVLKEYLLRGMVEKVLILTPASLVGQWQEEMATKFDIECATTNDSLVRTDPAAFWAQPRVIASLATARRQDHKDHLVKHTYDMVIVDEAHHLKNRTTRNYQLVDAVPKRFLLFLSATPVQNSLVELYNLLTLLKPGVFNTEKEFRASYVTPGKPRVPANRERMHDLMRDVMIRNTRAMVDVRLPARHALTLSLEADDEERSCYQALDELVREVHASGPGRRRLALYHLLSAAGSSPAAAAAAIHRFDGRDDARWRALYERYRALARGVKDNALLDVLHRNPDEKTMVFIHHRETLQHLVALLREQGIPFARFDGSLSSLEKDAAIDTFREQAPVLLSTQSGGEGRNVQFSNTLINYDLPWNPMVIEQRIGRIHRIGQTREVFVFNLAAQDTLESHVLRILEEKINMFELVVGEVGAMLGEMDEEQDFAETVFTTWVETTQEQRGAAFEDLGERMVKVREKYEAIKSLDTELFGDEFEAG
ncbi:MAG: DEAD/DEAH box helicase family protein [Armatimonadetes bacterium]|nr:DEAD/DEAH box helicase family protein [Armatimonadota bacterium]